MLSLPDKNQAYISEAFNSTQDIFLKNLEKWIRNREPTIL